MNSSFDDKAREQLSAHQPEVDMAALWGTMEPAVDALNAKRRKRRLLAWWFFSLAGLGLAAGLLWYFDPQEPPGSVDAAEMQAVAPGELLNRSAESHPAMEKGATTSRTPGATYRARITPILEAHLNKGRSKAGAESSASEEVAVPIPVVRKKSPLPSEPTTARTEVTTTTEPASVLVEETSNWSVLAFLPGRLTCCMPSMPELPELRESGEQSAPAPPRSPAFQFSIGLQGGASAAMCQLSTEDAGAQNLLELRQRTEQSLEVLQAGLRLGLVHRSGFGLASGLQWTRIAERMEFRDEVVNQDSVYGIMALAVNPFGDTTPIYGQVPHTTTTSINKRYYNYYQLIDLPLLAGYQQQVGKWWLGAEAGVYINLRLRSRGQILQPDYSGLDLAEAQPELFPNRIGLSYHLGLRASRELWPGVHLSLSPQWRYLPTLSVADNPIRQRYQLFGLQVGVVCEL